MIVDSEGKELESFTTEVASKVQKIERKETELSVGEYQFNLRTISDDFEVVSQSNGLQIKVKSTEQNGKLIINVRL